MVTHLQGQSTKVHIWLVFTISYSWMGRRSYRRYQSPPSSTATRNYDGNRQIPNHELTRLGTLLESVIDRWRYNIRFDVVVIDRWPREPSLLGHSRIHSLTSIKTKKESQRDRGREGERERDHFLPQNYPEK